MLARGGAAARAAIAGRRRDARRDADPGGRLIRFLLICLGGAAGTGARYLVATGALKALGPNFPFGTLAVNVVGSFLLAAVMELGLDYGAIPPDLRIILATGVMGGFTTYSSFNHETLGFLQRGARLLAFAYFVGTALGCLASGALGIACARWFAGG
jgi:fluoride exporter